MKYVYITHGMKRPFGVILNIIKNTILLNFCSKTMAALVIDFDAENLSAKIEEKKLIIL